MTETTEMIVSTLGELSLFKMLSAAQIVDLLSVCQTRKYKAGEVVCNAYTDSTEMFLLISGELSISSEDGIHITTLVPVTTVGEMGIMTGQPRLTTIMATKESEAFVITKLQYRFVG